jgi:hypothetical protein
MSSKIQSRTNPLQTARANVAKAKQAVTTKASQVKQAATTKANEAKAKWSAINKEKIEPAKKKFEEVKATATKWGGAAGKINTGIGQLKEIKNAHKDATKAFNVEKKNGKNVAVFKEPIKQGGIFTKAARKAGLEKTIKDAAKTDTPTKLPKWATGTKLGKSAEKSIGAGKGKWDAQGKPLKTVLDAAQIPKKVSDTVGKFKQAAASGKASDRSDARQSAIDTAKSTAETVKSGASVALQRGKKEAIQKAIQSDIKRIAGNSPSLAKKLGNPKVLSKVAERAAADKLKKSAFKTTAKVAQRYAVKGAAKGVGRLIPGANVAMAALDTATAVNTQRDPRKTNLQKAASWVTAGGSVAAATNVPIVSQVGAGVSAISDGVGAFLPNKK